MDQYVGENGQRRAHRNLKLKVVERRRDLKRAREYWEKSRDLYKRIGMANELKKVEGWIEGIKGK